MSTAHRLTRVAHRAKLAMIDRVAPHVAHGAGGAAFATGACSEHTHRRSGLRLTLTGPFRPRQLFDRTTMISPNAAWETALPANTTNESPTLYLTCGLPGSGKTTLAKEIERRAPALRLTGDEWLLDMFPHMTTREAETGPFRSRVERLQLATAMDVLGLARDVVLDWGIWSKEERDLLRTTARRAGARVVLCLLDPPLDELWARVSARNAEHPAGVFKMTRADLVRWSGLFQRPTPAELALFDVWAPWWGEGLAKDRY